jgi:hypothetical protein
MTDEYIFEKLKKWVPLFYGEGTKPWTFKDGEYYCFGVYPSILNRVTRPVALYLALGVDWELLNRKIEEDVKTRTVRCKKK